MLAILSACGGGGGGNARQLDPGSVAGTPIQTVVLSGLSQTASATSDGTVVQSMNIAPVNEANSTVTLGFDKDRNLSNFSINTPQSSVSYSGSEVSCRTPSACAGANANSVAVVMDALSMNWDYQSFGVWLKDLSTTSFQAGAISAGTVTPASALPTNLTNATFTGHAGGFYVDGAGNLSITDARMNAVVNFASRNINFSTTGTLLTDRSTLVQTPNPDLNLTGNWSYGLGTSQFTGVVTTPNGLSGSATGRFYGPKAEEIGGVYGLTSTTDRSRMIGAFGGKRP